MVGSHELLERDGRPSGLCAGRANTVKASAGKGVGAGITSGDVRTRVRWEDASEAPSSEKDLGFYGKC